MDNLPDAFEPGFPDSLTNAIEEALLVFSHSQAFVGMRGGNSSMLSGRSSVSVDENSFADIREASILDGTMVVSDKSHLEIAGDSQQMNGPLESVIRLDSLLEVFSDVDAGEDTMVGHIRVHDFSYLRSDDSSLGIVEVESFSNGRISEGTVGDIMCSNGSDIICSGTADPTTATPDCTCQPIP